MRSRQEKERQQARNGKKDVSVSIATFMCNQLARAIDARAIELSRKQTAGRAKGSIRQTFRQTFRHERAIVLCGESWLAGWLACLLYPTSIVHVDHTIGRRAARDVRAAAVESRANAKNKIWTPHVWTALCPPY